MKTSLEIEKDFRSELNKLLQKYDAEISIEEIQTYMPYAVPDKHIECTIESKYTKHYETLIEGVTFSLGRYICYEEPETNEKPIVKG